MQEPATGTVQIFAFAPISACRQAPGGITILNLMLITKSVTSLDGGLGKFVMLVASL